MLTEVLVKTPGGRKLVRRAGRQRTLDILRDMQPYLRPLDRIVDVGAGTCDVAASLTILGFNVTPVDVRDLSCMEDVRPILYDGRVLPFPADAFDVALLINVLHHVPEPDALLREASRVARCIIVHEDVFESPMQRRLTKFMDSVTNLEFRGHPHSNRDDAGWRATFSRFGLVLQDAKYKRFWGIFANATYHVERAQTGSI